MSNDGILQQVRSGLQLAGTIIILAALATCGFYVPSPKEFWQLAILGLALRSV